MKNLLFLFAFIMFYAIGYTQYVPTYVEASQGLGNPYMEGGDTEIEMADMDGDGNLDLVSVGDHGSPFINTPQHGVMIWFGDGNCNWSVVQNGDFGYGGVAVGDVDNDGIMDVGYGIHHNYSSTDLGDQVLEVALGDGTGLFWFPWDDGLGQNGQTWGMFGTDFADINCDGYLDIGSNSFGSGDGVHVHINNTDGSWTQSFGWIGGNSTMEFTFGDVNNDGFADFAVGNQMGTVYINDATGNFISADGNLPTSSYALDGTDLGDIDNDGMDELSMCNISGGLEVWKWSPGNVWTNLSSGLPLSGNYGATEIIDMDMDGFADLASFAKGSVAIWKGDGSGVWTQVASFTLPPQGYVQSFRVDGDVDHNGYPDIALVCEEGSWPSYQNHFHFFKEASAADSLSITPFKPGPFRFWHINSVRIIRWISEVPAGDFSWVKLEVSTTDSTGPWIEIVDSVPNNGHYQWLVPAAHQTYFARIKYTVYTLNDSATSMTADVFTIGPVTTNITENTMESTINHLKVYPNPVTLFTDIQYYVDNPQNVDISIFDISGKKIKIITSHLHQVGHYKVRWELDDSIGSGIYFCHLKTGNFSITKKLVILR